MTLFAIFILEIADLVLFRFLRSLCGRACQRRHSCRSSGHNGRCFRAVMAADLLEQPVVGSRRLSNVLVAGMVTIGGVGFLFASLSSYLGRDLLPLGHPAGLVFIPQGLVMGLYSIAAALLATYLWTVIVIDVGAGMNRFDKSAGVVTISRRGFRKPISVEIPIKDIKAVKVEVRDGFNTRRRVSLRVQGRRDMPLTRVGEPLPLAQLEQDGAELARFLNVNLEGL